MPLVSVIIPTYKHAQYVRESVESVFAQTMTDYEIIVVNDGSPDNTGEILRSLIDSGKIRYFEQPNQGQSRARNRAAAEASGEFIAFLDDDDLWRPGKLQWQVDFLRQNPSAAMVAGTAVFLDDPPGDWPGDVPMFRVEKQSLFKGNPILSPGQVMVRRSLFNKVGGFDPALWGVEDKDLYFRLADRGEFWMGGPVSLLYRRHQANASNQSLRMFLNGIAVAKKHHGDYGGYRNIQLKRTSANWLATYKWPDVRDQFLRNLREGQWIQAASLLGQTRQYWMWLALDPPMLSRILADLATSDPRN